jgi:hypothetical protein
MLRVRKVKMKGSVPDVVRPYQSAHMRFEDLIDERAECIPSSNTMRCAEDRRTAGGKDIV